MQAEPLYVKCLKVMIEVLGASHPETLTLLRLLEGLRILLEVIKSEI
jgi:hypothetical protein